MTRWAEAAGGAVVAALEPLADAEDAAHMSSYMRDQFAFLGIRSRPREQAWNAARREVEAEHGAPTAADVLAFAEAMWDREEREYQYVGARTLDRFDGLLQPTHLPGIRDLLVAKAWWDTVDILAPNVVGPMARRHGPPVVEVLDAWLVDDDRWLVRTALLHQLKAKDGTDRERLARYCRTAAGSDEFFIRKAIGWALRQYSYVDGTWVEQFVAEHEDRLSGLARREALKAVRRQR